MKTKNQADKQREREQKIKELRRDLEEKLEEQLPPDLIDEKIRVEVQKADLNLPLEPAQAKSIIEALLFASSKPMSSKEIKKVLKTFAVRDIEQMIADLKKEYEESRRSFEIYEIAGGYEIATRKEFAPWICRAEVQKRTKQATQSALETLAILAYKQPLTRAEIEELRGVDVSGVVTNLMERGFIKIVGKKEIPGRPFMYATTEKFLEHFGLNSLQDLPSIDEIKTMVEKSVKKEELLGTKGNMVDVPESQEGDTGSPSAEGSAPAETDASEYVEEDVAIAGEETAETAEDEISRAQIDEDSGSDEDLPEEEFPEAEESGSDEEEDDTEK